MNLHLHIDRLILDGVEVPLGKPRVLQAAVESELVRLLTAGGISADIARGGARPDVGAKPIRLESAKDPVALGRRIARSVYGGIGK
jgi:hypothetical protein